MHLGVPTRRCRVGPSASYHAYGTSILNAKPTSLPRTVAVLGWMRPPTSVTSQGTSSIRQLCRGGFTLNVCNWSIGLTVVESLPERVFDARGRNGVAFVAENRDVSPTVEGLAPLTVGRASVVAPGGERACVGQGQPRGALASRVPLAQASSTLSVLA